MENALRLLILSFYYPPDLSAGSFRVKALVEALSEALPAGSEIDVLTTMPNRYASLRREAAPEEDHGWLRVRRIELPAHNSGMVDQARAFVAYLRGVRAATAEKHWDVVFATSSRLMTGALGAHIARRVGAPLYLDVRDLFTDTMHDVLANNPMRVLLPAFRLLERRTLARAARVNLVSAGFLPHVKAAEPKHDYRVFMNGIDEEFMDLPVNRANSGVSAPALVVYAGNIGEGQGLHNILPEAAVAAAGVANFRVVGDGGRRVALSEELSKRGAKNVELLPPVPRDELIRHYEEADILFLHLNDYDAFRKVLPSKLFEYAATDKRMLVGVAGHAADFVRREIPDAEVFTPCDPAGMSVSLRRLIDTKTAPRRDDFRARFGRRDVMRRMAADVISLKD